MTVSTVATEAKAPLPEACPLCRTELPTRGAIPTSADPFVLLCAGCWKALHCYNAAMPMDPGEEELKGLKAVVKRAYA